MLGSKWTRGEAIITEADHNKKHLFVKYKESSAKPASPDNLSGGGAAQGVAIRQTRLSDRIENLTHKNSQPIPNYPRYKNGVTMQRWRAAAESRFEEYNQKTEKKLSRWRNKFVVHPALSVGKASGAALYGDDGAGGPPHCRPAPASPPRVNISV